MRWREGRYVKNERMEEAGGSPHDTCAPLRGFNYALGCTFGKMGVVLMELLTPVKGPFPSLQVCKCVCVSVCL